MNVGSEILKKLKQVDELQWDLPVTFKKGMKVPARFFATENILKTMDNRVFDQIANVASLPGIVKRALCMPDAHSGYGFPIGGVAAFDPEEGVISPGGIGFDINCGMRLLRTNLTTADVKPKIKTIIDNLFKTVPAGVGCKGFVKLSREQFNSVMTDGVKWCVENDYGWEKDLNCIEDYGCISWADPKKVSQRAISRGIDQLGTLGSGNHYLEVQMTTPGEIFDKRAAKAMGITSPDQIMIMIHCGSRGFGHQIGTDYLKTFESVMKEHKISVPDPELSCAPFQTKEAQDYFGAMACAANMAFANRQVIVHRIRECFSSVFKQDAESLGLDVVYDVAHNIAKLEKHKIDGKMREVLVHRKGATRAFGPGRSEIPAVYRDIGQPVIVGGSMETGSYLLVGTKKSEEETFGSTMHGSGRLMSRTQAKQDFNGEKLQKDMQKKGIYVQAVSMSGLAEEAGASYKNIDEVIDTMHIAGITTKVAKLRPIGNVKG